MSSMTVVVPMTIRRRGGRKQIFGPDGAPVRVGGGSAQETRGDPVLVKALARAFRWRRMLEEGQYASISEMAAAERVERGYMGCLLRLTMLAPDLVEAILDRRLRSQFGVPKPKETLPALWSAQRQMFAAQSPT